MTYWIFDFSNAQQSGAARRIEALLKYKDSKQKIVVIAQQSLVEKFDQGLEHEVFIAEPNFFGKIFGPKRLLKKIVSIYGKPKVFFSYGQPIFYPVADYNWFHLSNALNVYTKDITLSKLSKLKMLIRKFSLVHTQNNHQIISAESTFSINMIKKLLNENEQIRYRILPNGWDPAELPETVEKKFKFDYAIAIGIASYKRLDKAHLLFEYFREKGLCEKLVIIVSKQDQSAISKFVPLELLKSKNVILHTPEHRNELCQMMYTSAIYLSASEIENSSNSLLEACIFCDKICVSDIPAHAEFFEILGLAPSKFEISASQYLFFNNKIRNFDVIPTWDIVTHEMLDMCYLSDT